MSLRKLGRHAGAVIAAAVLTTAIGTPAAAQGNVNLVPWVGLYVPTSNSFSRLDEDFERDVSFIGGARISFWGSDHLGFEATGGYAPADISGETINDTSTDLLLANAKLMISISPVSSGFGFYVGGGGALLARGSDPFDDDESNTDLGGVIGAGLRIGNEDGRVGLRIDVEDYLYNGSFGDDDDFQNDLVLSLGVSIALGGKVGK
jgi:hypothetical protein